jgi:hypothetical protein
LIPYNKKHIKFLKEQDYMAVLALLVATENSCQAQVRHKLPALTSRLPFACKAQGDQGSMWPLLRPRLPLWRAWPLLFRAAPAFLMAAPYTGLPEKLRPAWPLLGLMPFAAHMGCGRCYARKRLGPPQRTRLKKAPMLKKIIKFKKAKNITFL